MGALGKADFRGMIVRKTFSPKSGRMRAAPADFGPPDCLGVKHRAQNAFDLGRAWITAGRICSTVSSRGGTTPSERVVPDCMENKKDVSAATSEFRVSY